MMKRNNWALPHKKIFRLGIFITTLFFTTFFKKSTRTTLLVLANRNYNNCDSDAIPDNKRLSSLTPNTIYKICPATITTSQKKFGEPKCGDGSNFAFYFTKPPKKSDNREKILIEFMGGGACWDAQTCGEMSDYLTFPSRFDDLVGLSCSEVSAGFDAQEDDYPISMLCARSIGNKADFTEYNTIIVPYCTQDVHVGSNSITYDDGSTVYHHGAHNMVQVMRWIYKNFPRPAHIALTGCSAGGTAIPVVYDLLYKHYNSIFKAGFRSVHINVISDSPVYLTPQYFLHNAFENWDPWPLMKQVGFNFKKYRYDTDYATKVMEHVLRRGSNNDQWGLLSHTDDPVSQAYFQFMSGAYADDDVYVDNYDDDDGNGDSKWWSELSSSWNYIKSHHRNVHTYLIDDEGHCTFGLYYGLQQSGFESWAANIFKETPVLGRTNRAVPLFLTSLLLGGALAIAALHAAKKRRLIALDDTVLLNNQMNVIQCGWQTKAWTKIAWFLLCFKHYPLTAGYGVSITFYFLTMILSGGFVHPVDNPSFGPNALILSQFGINNPSLIFYRLQLWRLISSGFLCSGILTYFIVMYSLWVRVRPLERALDNEAQFAQAFFSIMIGSNILYACFAEGASCSTVPLVLGLEAMSVGLGYKTDAIGHPRFKSSLSTTMTFIVVSILFPFNSWVMMLGAIILGYGIGYFLFDKMDDDDDDDDDEVMTARNDAANITTATSQEGNATTTTTSTSAVEKKAPAMLIRGGRGKVLGLLFFIFFIYIFVRIQGKPNKMYLRPYLTSCRMVYSDEVDDIVDSFYDGYNGENDADRRLEDENEEEEEDDDDDDDAAAADDDGNSNDNVYCGQVCVPLLIYRPVYWGIKSFVFPINKGLCMDNGYETHIADKTVSYMTYSLDVEVYSNNGYMDYDDDDDENERQ